MPGVHPERESYSWALGLPPILPWGLRVEPARAGGMAACSPCPLRPGPQGTWNCCTQGKGTAEGPLSAHKGKGTAEGPMSAHKSGVPWPPGQVPQAMTGLRDRTTNEVVPAPAWITAHTGSVTVLWQNRGHYLRANELPGTPVKWAAGKNRGNVWVALSEGARYTWPGQRCTCSQEAPQSLI